jgi:hypothetical protein
MMHRTVTQVLQIGQSRLAKYPQWKFEIENVVGRLVCVRVNGMLVQIDVKSLPNQKKLAAAVEARGGLWVTMDAEHYLRLWLSQLARFGGTDGD